MSIVEQVSDELTEVVRKLEPAVVQIKARRRFPASGTSISENTIITASHVIELEEEIEVMMSGEGSVPAAFVGRDAVTDLAVLKIKDCSLIPAVPYRGSVKVGQLAILVARPSGSGVQASFGMITATSSPSYTEVGGHLGQVYQTDAVSFPGFSGGPLIDIQGQVLGIHTTGLIPGSSLVIPTEIAWQTADAILRTGKVRRGYLGIRSQSVDLPQVTKARLRRDQTKGLLLMGIESGSPADQVGLMVGDILVDLAGKPVTDHQSLWALLGSGWVGQEVPIEVLRGGIPQVFPIMITEKG